MNENSIQYFASMFILEAAVAQEIDPLIARLTDWSHAPPANLSKWTRHFAPCMAAQSVNVHLSFLLWTNLVWVPLSVLGVKVVFWVRGRIRLKFLNVMVRVRCEEVQHTNTQCPQMYSQTNVCVCERETNSKAICVKCEALIIYHKKI